MNASQPASRLSAPLRASAPGRVCLFGEHQDYLQLPVIACAISLRIAVEGRQRNDLEVSLDLPDISSNDSFSLDGPLHYTRERDYFRSALNVLRREGMTFSHGLDCSVHGAIPINAGTSSSSALIVAWVKLLARLSDQRRDLSPGECARLAHCAEVVEFNEPGGMMDHCSCAYGGVAAIDFFPSLKVEVLHVSLGTFVLGDSGDPKDTKRILSRVKDQVLEGSRRLREVHPGFSLHTTTAEAVRRYATELNPRQGELLCGTVRNRDITREARDLLGRKTLDHHRLGSLVNEHQSVLRDTLMISTKKIDAMLEAAMGAGALGGKINGSGGGGCMFVYAPEKAGQVAEAIERAGGRAYVVTPDSGARIEHSEGAG